MCIHFFSPPAFLKYYFYLFYGALAVAAPQDDLCPMLAVSFMVEGKGSAIHALCEVG